MGHKRFTWVSPFGIEEGAEVRTKLPDPQCPWINITATYDTITKKLNNDKPKPSTADRLTAIDYWMARLKEDRASIASGGDGLTH